ncbi:MAG: hypothetical protein Kow0020_09990 [Wenzhouxiangellaceae bacterium]
MYTHTPTQRTATGIWRLTATTALLVALLATSLPALALQVTGSFTGWWGQPEQENHGLIIAVSRRANGEVHGAVYWAVYDDQGKPSWFLAQGPINGDTIDAELYAFEGPTFMQPEDPNSTPGELIGSLQVRFNDCNNGFASFESTRVVVGTGGFPIRRISNQPGTNCSGGVSDNTPPVALPETFRVDLLPTGAIPGAGGHAQFESRPGLAEFKVEVEDLPLGTYSLHVGGQERALIEVVSTAGGNRGKLEFSSPPEPGKLLLDFEPRNQLIEIVAGSTVVLDSTTPAAGTVPGSGNGAPPFGNLEVEIDLQNTGVHPAGYAKAELEQRSNRVDFEVEVEDVPTGSYTLRVDGVERGQISVVNTASGPEGELEFRFPGEAGKELLDFDPRGALVEIVDAGTVVFASTFPATGTGGGGGGGGPTGDIEIVVGMINDGVYPSASAEAKFEQNTQRTEFSVEVEDVPDGSYALFVGGAAKGTITVTDGEGEIEFRDPPEAGKLPLDFDPRGQSVEVREGATVVFHVDFPN